MKSVRIRLTGGLGNQMFQYAAARALAIRAHAPLELDLSWFGTNEDRQFALAPFNIDGILTGGDGKRTDRSEGKLKRILARVLYRFHLLSRWSPVYKERSFEFDPQVESLSAPVFLKGYFQSERYFGSVAEIIRKDFGFNQEPAAATARMLEAIRNSDAICVHVRRGDYVHNAKVNAETGTCSVEYYQRGLGEAAKNLENPHCFVFSDEPDWVKENLKLDLPMTVVDIHGTDQAHEDLRLMAACKNFLIANSSLSWWGAWLGAFPEKRVVAPAKWFKSGDKNTADLLPKEWIAL